jgi:hypothetical protein
MENLLRKQIDYVLKRNPVSDVVLLRLDPLPTASDFLRLFYTSKHKIDTVEGVAIEAVACYAAHLLALQLSGYYSSATESTLSIDSANQAPRASHWSSLSKTLKQRYLDLLNVKSPDQKPNSTTLNWDNWSSTQDDRVTHSNRYR